MSDDGPDVGGMTVWPGTHRDGVRRQRRDARGHLECVVDEAELACHRPLALGGHCGDLVVFHSNILHRSEKNYSDTQTRLVQLFRYSDLRDAEAQRVQWQCADVTPGAPRFETLYPELVAAPT